MLRGARFEARGQTLASLIAFAYSVNDRGIVGPNWLDSDRFDITARSAAGATPAQQRHMLQTLLRDRFTLVVRQEDRLQEAWALALGKGALQLKRAEGSDFTGCRNAPQPPGATRVYQEIDCRNVPAAVIAARLQGLSSGYFSGPVTDATGLTGTWDVRFAVTPSSARAAADDGPSVFDAAERLGLRLERRDTPVPVLIIDSVAQTPTANAPGTAEALAPLTKASEFEVVTVRPAAPGQVGGGRGGLGAILTVGPAIQPNGRMLFRGATVRDLIGFAWDVPPTAVVGGPEFVGTERFEVVGDAPSSMARPVDVDEFRPMVRALLASRFGLAVHEETRPTDAYVLTAKREIKMATGNDAERGGCRSTPERIPPNSGLSSAITCTNTTMAQLADRLQGMAPNYINGKPVFDETKLTGTYDFLVLWTGLATINGRVNALQPGDKEAALAPVGTLTVFESLDRLGVRVVEEKRPVPALVIDRVQRPTDN
jgi:uncharacterized protein (TIGR03435 family)